MFTPPSLVVATQDLNQVADQIARALGPEGDKLYFAGVGLLEQAIDLLPWNELSAHSFVMACQILLTRFHAHLLSGNLLVRAGFVVDATLSARAAVETLWLLDYLHRDPRELRRWLGGDYISAARVRRALSDTALRHRIYDELCAQSHPNQIGLAIYTVRPGQARTLAGATGSLVPYAAMRFYTLLLLLSQGLLQCQDWLATAIQSSPAWERQMLALDRQIISYQDPLYLRAGVPAGVGQISEQAETTSS
jgi:hypothetical protein